MTRKITGALSGAAVPPRCLPDIGALFADPSLWARLVAGAVGGARRHAHARLVRPEGDYLAAHVDVIALMEGSSARFLLRLSASDRAHPVPITQAGDVRRELPPPPADPRAVERLALINSAASEIGSSLDMVRNAEQLTGVLVPAFADLAAVDLTEPVLLGEEPGDLVTGAPMRRVAVRAADGGWPSENHAPEDIIRLGSVESAHLRGGTAVFLPDLSELRTVLAGEEDRIRLILPPAATSLMLVPLQARGMVLGALVLWRTAGHRPFDQADASLAEEVGFLRERRPRPAGL